MNSDRKILYKSLFKLFIAIAVCFAVISGIKAVDYSSYDNSKTILSGNFFETLVFIGSLMLAFNVKFHTENKLANIFFILIGINSVLCRSFDLHNSSEMITSSGKSLLFSIIEAAGICFTLLIIYSYYKENKKSINRVNDWLSVKISNRHHNTLKFVLLSVIILFCKWCVVLIIRYPAGVEWDMYHQILEYYGLWGGITQHWPPLSTIIAGGIVSIGYNIFKTYEAGIFLFVLIQCMIGAIVVGYGFLILIKINSKPLVLMLYYGFFLLAPIVTLYMTSAVKDTLYAESVLLLLIELIDIMLLGDSLKKRILLTCTTLLTCLLRNNGKYCIIGCIIILLIMNAKKYNVKHILHELIVALLLTFIINNVVYPYFGITNNDPVGKEALSIPFQQTARYLKNYPDDITEDEIDAIASELDYENIAELYDPLLSDPVKGTAHGDITDVINYLKAWAKMFVRHPVVYFVATFNNSYGFISLDATNTWIYESEGGDADKIIYKHPDFLDNILTIWKRYILFTDKVPIIRLFNVSGIYFYLTAYWFIDDILKKQHINMLIDVSSIVGMMVCIASPCYFHNGLRYALPVIFCMPLLCALRNRGKYPLPKTTNA